ncbi:MAG TPA: potassium channel family protein [Alcanivorax sp.]|nr:potassium channel family protein [Alcanivorax sp.]
MTPLRFLTRRRSAFNQATRGLDLNLKSRLHQVFFWLLVLTALHTTAMVVFEGLSWDDALWLTLTTLTTVGYGDLSAATPAGRLTTVLLLYVAGITLLAQLASDYIDHRLKRKEYMLKGRWRWNMKDHLLINRQQPQAQPGLVLPAAGGAVARHRPVRRASGVNPH